MASTAVAPNTSGPFVSVPNGNPVLLSKTMSTASVPSTNSSHEESPRHIPSLTLVMPGAPKNFKDVLAYEDKWIAWNGPVWCKRYGRFEIADDAAKDDGFESAGQVHHQDLGPQHIHQEGCICHTPFEHHSYVEDIKRRLQPMVASLVNLEHQVTKLIRYVGLGAHIPHDNILVLDAEVMDSHHHERNERFAMHDDGLSQFATHQTPFNRKKENLEAEIHALQHQLREFDEENCISRKFHSQYLMINNGNGYRSILAGL